MYYRLARQDIQQLDRLARQDILQLDASAAPRHQIELLSRVYPVTALPCSISITYLWVELICTPDIDKHCQIFLVEMTTSAGYCSFWVH